MKRSSRFLALGCCAVVFLVIPLSLGQGSSILGSLPYADGKRVIGSKFLNVSALLAGETNLTLEVDSSWPTGLNMSEHQQTWRPVLLKAREAALAGKNEEALRHYNEFLDANPDHLLAVLWKADLLYTSKNYGSAEACYLRVLEAEPDSYLALNNLAWLYATAEDMGYRRGGVAVRFAKKALVQVPDNFHIWSTVAEAHYVRGEYEEAYHAAREALRFAEQQKAAERLLTYYLKQVDMARLAHEAMSIME